MLYFLIFLFELILLFLLSKKLVNSLARFFYKFTRNHKLVVSLLAILFLPGTVVHELGHLLFAGIMLVPLGEMDILPEIEERGVKLGSVQIGHTDPIRRTIIGVAPILLGLLLIFAIFLLVKIGSSPWWQVILALYFIFAIGNTMFSSKKDIEGVIGFLIAIAIIALASFIALYFLNPTLLQNIWLEILKLNLDFLVNFFKQAAVYLLVPTALDLLIILFSSFSKRSY